MNYLVTSRHAYTVQAYLDDPRGEPLVGRLRIIPYQELPYLERLPLGTWVFSDHERLTADQMELARSTWKALEAAGDRVRLLNDPEEVLTRYPLLRKLHETGRNHFRVFRVSELPDSLRFPVFVREERDHTGGLTDLIHDRESLDRAIRKLTSVLSQLRLRDLLVVEFCDVSDRHGMYRKYSAFRIADTIMARYLDVGRTWMVKGRSKAVDEKAVQEEKEYLDANPHADWVRECFDLANIEYGRIDYGIVDGELQVWEINTNPRIGPAPKSWGQPPFPMSPELRAERMKNRGGFHEVFHAAFEALDLDPGAPGEGVELELDPGLRKRLKAELRWEKREQLRRRVRRRLRMAFPWIPAK